MARIAKPWWRSARQSYFVTIRGTVYNLGADKAEADREYHRLLSEKPAVPVEASTGLSIAEVFDKYLDFCLKHRATRTYEWYREFIQSFLYHLKGKARLPWSELRPFHVTEWTDAHPAWNDTSRRGAMISIQRPFNYAAKLGYIDHCPIRALEKPQAKRREAFISPAEWERIRDHYKDADPFRDLLECMWETGGRPQEIRAIETHHVDIGQKQVAFPPEEAKGKKRWRVILLTDRAAEIIGRRMKGQKKGFVFQNEDGKPWNYSSMNCRFKRLQKTLGIKHFAYSFRHGFCQRKLESGVDHLTVAALMGHADGAMVAKVYSHMNKATGHLREALTRGEGASA